MRGGILLYAPALIYMFPQIPQWVAKVFPTYYMIEPIVEIVQHGGGWPDIAFDVSVLVGLIAVLAFWVALAARRTRQYAV